MLEWLENRTNFQMITGSAADGKKVEAGQQLKKTDAYKSLAEWINSHTQDKQRIWCGEVAKSRYESFITKYKKTAKLLDPATTGEGVNDADREAGIMTIEQKCEKLCPHFANMDLLYGHRQNVNPAMVVEVGSEPSMFVPSNVAEWESHTKSSDDFNQDSSSNGSESDCNSGAVDDRLANVEQSTIKFKVKRKSMATPPKSTAGMTVKIARTPIQDSTHLTALPEGIKPTSTLRGTPVGRPAERKSFASTYAETQERQMAQDMIIADRQLQLQREQMVTSEKIQTRQARAKMMTELLVGGLSLANAKEAVECAFPDFE